MAGVRSGEKIIHLSYRVDPSRPACRQVLIDRPLALLPLRRPEPCLILDCSHTAHYSLGDLVQLLARNRSGVLPLPTERRYDSRHRTEHRTTKRSESGKGDVHVSIMTLVERPC